VSVPKKRFTKEHLYSLFVSNDFRLEFNTLVTGTSGSYQRVKPDYLLNMSILNPPNGLIEAYSDAVSPIFEKISSNLDEQTTLERTRDAL